MPRARWPLLALTLGLGLGLLALGLLVLGAVRRGRLGLSNEVSRVLPLAFPALGPPALAPDGRLFVLVAGARLVALEASGQLLFSKHVPTPRRTELALGGELVIVVGEAGLHGYSLGGEARFSLPLALSPMEPLATSRSGVTWLLDGAGSLLALDGSGRERARLPLLLKPPHALLVLSDERVAAAGRTATGRLGLRLVSGDGRPLASADLDEPPGAVALAPAGDGELLLSVGSRVLVLRPPTAGAEPAALAARRIELPGPARSPARRDATGAVHVIVELGAQQVLCRLHPGAPDRCTGLGIRAATTPADAPLLTAAGTALVPFVDDGARLLPRLHGVLAAPPQGPPRRSPLPEGGRTSWCETQYAMMGRRASARAELASRMTSANVFITRVCDTSRLSGTPARALERFTECVGSPLRAGRAQREA